MDHAETSFPAAQLAHKSLRQQFAAQRLTLWGNEHTHAALTATALLVVAVASRWAGLSIAPIACVIFAVVLLAADVRTRLGKHD